MANFAIVKEECLKIKIGQKRERGYIEGNEIYTVDNTDLPICQFLSSASFRRKKCILNFTTCMIKISEVQIKSKIKHFYVRTAVHGVLSPISFPI
jgi:hypothetical protein